MPLRRLFSCCCSCMGEEEDEAGYRNESDYLLPGGEWDPSLSSSVVKRRSRRSRGRDSGGASGSGSFADNGAGGEDSESLYTPPEVPGATSVPKFQDFKLLKTVGKGAFGKCPLRHEGVPKTKIRTQKQTNQILSELNILKRIQHPFCVALKSTFQDKNFLFYIFCFAAGGMLFYHLRQEGKFTEPRARFYLGEIVLALNYLHGFSIIFRDLKPENCMLSEQGHVILTDFGSAKSLEMRERANTLAGTPQYMAPETPFNSADRGDLYKMVLRGDYRVPNFVSPRARSLIYKMINRDPEFRLGCSSAANRDQAVSEIKDHAFFSNTPMDPDEEMFYSTEEAERERHRQALARARRSRERDLYGSGSIVGAASSVLRSLSIRRISGSGTCQGAACEWNWEDLENMKVTPPFKPLLFHIDGFDYTTGNGQSASGGGGGMNGTPGGESEGPNGVARGGGKEDSGTTTKPQRDDDT
ncbi:Protein kinase 2 [Geodia barretti]|uniref:Protein kinase 2 n=1 Tax=Geodia barretti TaxID=519541 RepID=A0AA35XA61_GEOBA|nr:Protein kinase 2 [Geodia barretti]